MHSIYAKGWASNLLGCQMRFTRVELANGIIIPRPKADHPFFCREVSDFSFACDFGMHFFVAAVQVRAGELHSELVSYIKT